MDDDEKIYGKICDIDTGTYLYYGGKVHRYEKKKIKHLIIISDVVRKIPDQAFERCLNLQTVQFESSSSSTTSLSCLLSSSRCTVEEIGNRTFFRMS